VRLPHIGLLLLGAAAMGAFWLGGVPAVSAVGLGGDRLLRRFGAAGRVVAAVVVIGAGVWMLAGHSAHANQGGAGEHGGHRHGAGVGGGEGSDHAGHDGMGGRVESATDAP